MTIGYAESYKIAAGWNVALGSLVNIESINPGDGDTFDGPKGLPLYDDGQVEGKPTGALVTLGYPSVKWKWTRMTFLQYSYLKTTYCAGGLSGLVTIYTTLGGATYYRMNAYMHIKKPVEMDSEYRYKEVEVTFVRLVASS